MRNKIILFVLTALLGLSVLLLMIGSSVTGKNLPISVTVESQNGKERISCWTTDQTWYFFLPSYAEMNTASFDLDTDVSIILDGRPIYDGMSCGDFACNVSYDAQYTIFGVKRKAQVTFIKSDAVATMFVDTESGNMEYIHAKKGNQESGIMRIYSPEGQLHYDGAIQSINGRGNSSWDGFEKKPYGVTLQESADLLNLGAAQKYVLLANAGDPSHLRNKIVYDFAEQLGFPYSPKSAWVDLYLNGNYAGLYLLAEKNEVHPQRVDIPLDTGVLVSKENSSHLMSKDVPKVITTQGLAFRIHNGSDETAILEQLQSVENAILSENAMDLQTGKSLEELIDIDSWARKYLIEEFFGNIHSGHASQFYYWNTDDGTVYAGPVWDYDNAMWQGTASGLFSNQFEIKDGVYSYWNYSLWQKKFFQDSVKSLYATEFQPKLALFLDEKVPEYSRHIAQAGYMDQQRWPDYGGDLAEESTNVYNYLSERQDFLTELWFGDKAYSTVCVDMGRSSNYMYYAVETGTCMEPLPVLDNPDCIGLYYRDTGEKYELEHPITEDVYLTAKWRGGDATKNRIVLELIPILVIAVLFLAVLVWNIYRAKREGER